MGCNKLLVLMCQKTPGLAGAMRMIVTSKLTKHLLAVLLLACFFIIKIFQYVKRFFLLSGIGINSLAVELVLYAG